MSSAPGRRPGQAALRTRAISRSVSARVMKFCAFWRLGHVREEDHGRSTTVAGGLRPRASLRQSDRGQPIRRVCGPPSSAGRGPPGLMANKRSGCTSPSATRNRRCEFVARRRHLCHARAPAAAPRPCRARLLANRAELLRQQLALSPTSAMSSLPMVISTGSTFSAWYRSSVSAALASAAFSGDLAAGPCGSRTRTTRPGWR